MVVNQNGGRQHKVILEDKTVWIITEPNEGGFILCRPEGKDEGERRKINVDDIIEYQQPYGTRSVEEIIRMHQWD